MKIIYESKDIISVIKNPGELCQSDIQENDSLIEKIQLYLGKKSEVYVVHRLDRPVGGIMVFAKNKDTAYNLSRQIQDRTFNKKYLAVVCGEPDNEGTLINYLVKNQRKNMSQSVHKNVRNSKEAILHYRKLKVVYDDMYKELSLMEIDLVTGRHHQIRVQLSTFGYPIWGDTKYNNMRYNCNFVNIALWAYKLEFYDNNKNKIYLNVDTEDIFPFNLF